MDEAKPFIADDRGHNSNDTLSKLTCTQSRAKAAAQELSNRAHGVTSILVKLTPSDLEKLSVHDLKERHAVATEWLNNPPSLATQKAKFAELKKMTLAIHDLPEAAILRAMPDPKMQDKARAMPRRDLDAWLERAL